MLQRLRVSLTKHDETLRQAALLFVRVSVGVVFLQSGWGKLHDLPAIIEFFASLGIPAPQLQAPFVSGLEFAGGVALLLGPGKLSVDHLLAPRLFPAR